MLSCSFGAFSTWLYNTTAFLIVSPTPSVCQVVLAMRSVTSGTASIAFISFPGLIWYQTLKKMSGLNNAGSHPCGRLPEHNTCPTESLGVFDCLRLLADHSLQMDEVVAQCIEGFHALLSYSICHRRIVSRVFIFPVTVSDGG